MSKLDDFFSIEKMEYPICGSIFFGILLKTIEIITKTNINEIFFWIIMIVGFLLGSFYKIKKIEENRNKKSEK